MIKLKEIAILILVMIVIFYLQYLGVFSRIINKIPNDNLCYKQNTKLLIKNKILDTYVACSMKEKEVGLMNIKTLDENQGMIFVFDNEEIQTFWMKDTLIPLSIAFLNHNKEIIDIQEMYANDETPVPSSSKALYAIEANQFWFSKNNIKVGDKVSVSP